METLVDPGKTYRDIYWCTSVDGGMGVDLHGQRRREDSDKCNREAVGMWRCSVTEGPYTTRLPPNETVVVAQHAPNFQCPTFVVVCTGPQPAKGYLWVLNHQDISQCNLGPRIPIPKSMRCSAELLRVWPWRQFCFLHEHLQHIKSRKNTAKAKI